MAALPPGLMLYWERISPSHVGKGGFAPIMRLATGVGLVGGFLMFYQRSIRTCKCSPPPFLRRFCLEHDAVDDSSRLTGNLNQCVSTA